MSEKIEGLVWTCHVCQDFREDKFISVFTRDISSNYALPAGTAQENVRYCNDRAECREGAPAVTFIRVRHA